MPNGRIAEDRLSARTIQRLNRIDQKKAARLIIPKENPLTLKASQSDRLSRRDGENLAFSHPLSNKNFKKLEKSFPQAGIR